MLFWRILYEENRFWDSFLMSEKKMGCKSDGDEHEMYIMLFDVVACGLSNGFRHAPNPESARILKYMSRLQLARRAQKIKVMTRLFNAVLVLSGFCASFSSATITTGWQGRTQCKAICGIIIHTTS